MKHDIPDWFIPDHEIVLANEHETEEIEEHGELEEPLCPHCGNTYLDNSGDWYTHQLVEVPSDQPGEDPTLKPGIVCVNGEKRRMNGFRDPDTENYLL
ncbi:hypothetical protein ACFQGE_07455 [Halomicroarcula sp. GCM10025817]|uniref:hypothetical protein n=1 Tax=Haloarcula TaxID=2237 RepID=UPI0023E8B27E|nr:hypothetical protein [Halomicroarcula sp. SYNS111]